MCGMMGKVTCTYSKCSSPTVSNFKVRAANDMVLTAHSKEVEITVMNVSAQLVCKHVNKNKPFCITVASSK